MIDSLHKNSIATEEDTDVEIEDDADEEDIEEIQIDARPRRETKPPAWVRSGDFDLT